MIYGRPMLETFLAVPGHFLTRVGRYASDRQRGVDEKHHITVVVEIGCKIAEMNSSSR
jgi:hypothetical protein